jgi:bile acid:Na+ symporter, BASS family
MNKICIIFFLYCGTQPGWRSAWGIAAQMGKIATIDLAPAVNGSIMNTSFSLIATWWGSKPLDDEPKPVV